MSRISVTLNPYEYEYVMHLRNIPLYSGMNMLETTEIKAVLWDLLNFSVGKARSNRASFVSLVNQFLRKANLPFFPEESDKEDFRFRQIENEFEGNVISVERIRDNTYENALFNMNLTKEEEQELDGIIDWIGTLAKGIKSISYSQLFRECLHFVIDRQRRLIEFSSVVYTGTIFNLSPSYAIGLYSNQEEVDEEIKNTLRLNELKSVYKKFNKWLNENPMPWGEKIAQKAFKSFQFDYEALLNLFVGFLTLRQFITYHYMNIPSIVLNALYSPQGVLYKAPYNEAVKEFSKYMDYFLSILCK